MKTIEEIIETLGEVVGRELSVPELTGTYTKKGTGKGNFGSWERGAISDDTGSLGFFVPKGKVGKIPDGSEITIINGVAECGEYKERLQYTMNMKGADIELLKPIPEEILKPKPTGQATGAVQPPAKSEQIDGNRVDMALFQAIKAIENHKDKIKELIEAGIIKPIELNALTATVLIDNKR